MNKKDLRTEPEKLELWGGLECTVNRVDDQYFSQMERNGHAKRADDIDRFASLGIKAIRYPILWERTAPNGVEHADWTWPDERLAKLRERGITPIAGLVHHGSGPEHTSLVSPCFPEKLATYAAAVAARYPWLEYYTPVNEPLTTARFAGLYGVWYPHKRDDRSFIDAVIVQCRATVLAMAEIRKVNPNAKLVQTDDLGKTYATADMMELADFYNERRWLAWDFLCGMVDEEHPLWDYLLGTGVSAEDLLWFKANPCPPDIIGVNYYVTSERWLDHRTERYFPHHIGHYRGRPHADIEASRALAVPTPGITPLLMEVWERYGLPLAVTEAHIDAHREDQLRWLMEIWHACRLAKSRGVDMRAVTVWALLGSFDWNCLVTQCRGYYEPGPFDVRAPEPRPTAVANLMRELATGKVPTHPVLQGEGWWHRAGRFFCQPVASKSAVASLEIARHLARDVASQPILISGANGTLGRAFAQLCGQRNLAFKLLSRQEMDVAVPASVEKAIERYQPWAIINAGGYVRVDDAETDAERCFRDNAEGPAVLAKVCAAKGIQLLNFSSDLVFDGSKGKPYVESDPVAPLNNYGRSKAQAERDVLALHPDALTVRTSAFFGPWDDYNFVTLALKALASGESFTAASDIIITPTYVPDLVNVSLDLLIDREKGLWHLSNATPVSWFEFARQAAEMAGVDASRLQAATASELGYQAPRPGYTALSSERGWPMPSLEDALGRYMHVYREVIAPRFAEQAGQAVLVGNSK